MSINAGELIEKLKKVDPKSTIYASIDLGDTYHFENALGNGLIEIIDNKRDNAVLLSFELGEIVNWIKQ